MAAPNAICFDASPWHHEKRLRAGLPVSGRRRWVPRVIASDNLQPGVRRLTPAEAREVLDEFKRQQAAAERRVVMASIPGYDRLK